MRRYLVVAHRTLGGAHLVDELHRLRREDPYCTFHLIVPEYHPAARAWNEHEVHLAAARTLDAMLERFRERAGSVRRRQIPPVEGEARREFVRQAELDFQDFAIIADADASLEDGVLVLRIDLRPPDERG
jgi:hypothetical protein